MTERNARREEGDESDAEDRDSRYGWYLDKLLDLLSLI